MLTRLSLAAVLLLSACATAEERFGEDCREYGFRPGTESYANCLMQQEHEDQRHTDAVMQGVYQRMGSEKKRD